METHEKLQDIQGIGSEVADSLIAHGIDSIETLAQATPETLGQIPGLAPELIPRVIAEARRLLARDRREAESLSDLLADSNQLKSAVEKLVWKINSRFGEGEYNDQEKKSLRREIALTLGSLERVETTLGAQLRRFHKGLAKADAKISAVVDSDVQEILAGLKKARRKIDRAVD